LGKLIEVTNQKVGEGKASAIIGAKHECGLKIPLVNEVKMPSLRVGAKLDVVGPFDPTY
jgi:hypothetical protein